MQARNDVFAIQISIKEYYEVWHHNLTQNAPEEPDHPEPPVSYQERLGNVDATELFEWRFNGYLCIGTRAQRDLGFNASERGNG